MAVSHLERIKAITLARELRRVLKLIWGEAWDQVYEDLIVDNPGIPDLEELADFDRYDCKMRELAEMEDWTFDA